MQKHRTIPAILALAALMSFSTTLTADKAAHGDDAATMLKNGFKRYGVESGIIKYTMSGYQSGTETVYFDHWGLREAKYTDASMEMMGVKQHNKTLTILDGEIMYSVDLEKNTASRMANPMFKQLTGNYKTKHLGEAGLKMMEGLGGKNIGSEKILGHNCTIWELAQTNTKTWIWQHIPLKTQANIMNVSVTMLATEFSPNAKVAESKFALPAGVSVNNETGIQFKLPDGSTGK